MTDAACNVTVTPARADAEVSISGEDDLAALNDVRIELELLLAGGDRPDRLPVHRLVGIAMPAPAARPGAATWMSAGRLQRRWRGSGVRAGRLICLGSTAGESDAPAALHTRNFT